MKKFVPLLFGTFAATLLPSAAVTLVQDGFAGTGTLNTHVPDTTGTTAWSANAGFNVGSGSVSYAQIGTTFAAGMGSIDMGSGYFASHPGIYQLSMDVSFGVASANTGVWGLGFSANTSTLGGVTLASGGDSSQIGQPWMFIRENGNVSVRNNSSSVNVFSSSTGAYPGNLTHNLRITLDTSSAIWTYSAFVDNTQIVAPTAFSPSNPNLRYIAITATTTAGTIDNFALNFTAIPEPSALALAAGGILGFSLLRKRRI